MITRGLRLGLRLIVRPAAVEASLWRRLRYELDLACRTLLFDHHIDFARRVARGEARRRPIHGMDQGDVDQLAFAALLEAIDGFDPLQGAPFEAYARPHIRGALSDTVARSSEAGAVYAHQRRVHGERIRSLSRRGANKEDALNVLRELATGLAVGFIVEDAAKLLEEQEAPELNAYESLAWRELQRDMLAAIAALPDAERIILQQHYLNGVGFTQIAKLLGLSAGRISQLHKTALMHVRARLRYKD